MSTSKTVAAAAIGLMLVVGSTAAETTLESVRAKAAAGSSTEALAELERLLAERPRQPEALFLKGVLLGEAGRTAEAREVFEELIRLRRFSPTSR